MLRAQMGGGDCQGAGDGGGRQEFSDRRGSRETHWCDPFLVMPVVNNQARNQLVERGKSEFLRLPGLGLPVAQT